MTLRRPGAWAVDWCECLWDTPASATGLAAPTAQPPSGGAPPPTAAGPSSEGTPPSAEPAASPEKGEIERQGAPPEGEPQDVDDSLTDALIAEEHELRQQIAALPVEADRTILNRRLRRLERQRRRQAEVATTTSTELTMLRSIMAMPAVQAVIQGASRGPTSQEPSPPPPEFPDPTSYPFETTDASGQFFVNMHRDQVRLARQVETLTRTLEGLRGESQQTRAQTVQQQWEKAVEAALPRVAEPYRDMFRAAVGGEYLANVRGEFRSTPEAAIKRWLEKLPKVEREEAARAETVLRHNLNLPRQGGPGVRQPANPLARKPERIADVARRIRQGFR